MLQLEEWDINLKSNSLKTNIWIYLIIFTLIIILFLWLFQVVFINSFYEYSRIKQIQETAYQIHKNYDSINTTALEKLSYKNDVCIEIVKDYITIYSSNYQGCLSSSEKYKQDFYASNVDNKTYKLVNPKFDNKAFVYALKIEEGIYVFVNASIEPLNTTVIILSKQLTIVTGIVIILALIIGYFISKMISKPIERINNKASLLSKGNYNFTFDAQSGIEEIDSLANTLNYTKTELQHTDELRRDLMANVSHDLKTPLTMIKGYAEMVRDLTYKNKEKREENLNTIIEEVDRLNILVEDILDLSKLQAHSEELNIVEFDLVELINSIMKRYKLLKDTENYDFVYKMPDHVLVKADKKKIEQVIYNLVNNAINYTGKDNKIFIRVIKGNGVRVEIEDTGEGIPKEDIPYIWDKYYHNQKKHKRNKIGTGLGLSIVKNILENHHFEYGIKSEIKKGTCFYFIIK